jgi:hypothetical protein
MFAGNDDTDEEANLKANYPIAYLIAKFTNSRSIDVAALRDAVKSRLKVADLPSFCQRMDYFHAIAYFLTTTENDDGVVVPVNEVHVNHAKDNVPKPRLYGDLLEFILTGSIEIDDGTVTAAESSDSDGDSDSDSDSDSSDDEQTKRSRRKRKARRSGRGGTKKRKAAKGLGSRFAYTSPPSKRGNVVSFLDDTKTFKAGNPVKVSASDISQDPSKGARYWRGLAVVAFDKEGSRLNGVIARISPPTTRETLCASSARPGRATPPRRCLGHLCCCSSG